MVRLEHSIEEQKEEIKKLKGRRVPEREGSEEEQEEEEDNMHNDTIQEFPDRYQRRGRGRERTRPDRARRQATANQQKMNVSKIISTLPQFSGKAGSWESFISTFTAVTRKLEINDNEKLDFLLISFRNEAAEFKDLLPETVRQNYDEVVRRCSERFGKKEDEITTRRQLAAIKQYVDESVDQFAERIERLVRQAFPTATEDIANAMAVDAFIKGCSNKRAALMVADQDPQPRNINEAVRKIKAHISNQAAILGESANKIRRYSADKQNRSPSYERPQFNRRYSPSDRNQDVRYDEKYNTRERSYRYDDRKDRNSYQNRDFRASNDRYHRDGQSEDEASGDRRYQPRQNSYRRDESYDRDRRDIYRRDSRDNNYSRDRWPYFRDESPYYRRDRTPDRSFFRDNRDRTPDRYRRDRTPERYRSRNNYEQQYSRSPRQGDYSDERDRFRNSRQSEGQNDHQKDSANSGDESKAKSVSFEKKRQRIELGAHYSIHKKPKMGKPKVKIRTNANECVQRGRIAIDAHTCTSEKNTHRRQT